MFIIGIDPHKASHTATVIDGDEQLLDELRLRADCRQRDRLIDWAAQYSPRVWAVEGAAGTGALLAQQLVSVGETVIDVPPALSARVRLLDSGRKDKTDAHDARSAAIVALRHRNLHAVTQDNHVQVLRLLARRHHQLIAGRTRAICRLHALLATMVAGGLPPKLTAKRAAAELGKIRPADAVGRERKHIAVEFLDEVRRHDRALGELDERVKLAVAAANSNVTTVYGVGPIVACYLLGYSGDVRRLPTAGHYARYNATAPIEASSGPRVRHRLNPNGNRQLNHAIHIAALGQISHDTAGRDYYQRKIADAKTPKEAFRALKRRISDAIYRQLRADLTPLNRNGPGKAIRGDSVSSAAGKSLNADTSEQPFPDPDHNARTENRTCHERHPNALEHPRKPPLDTNRVRSGTLLPAGRVTTRDVRVTCRDGQDLA